MAVDSKQKRMSAIALTCPWRGTKIDPTESGFNAGNRAAVIFLYSGLATAAVAVRKHGGAGLGLSLGLPPRTRRN